MSCSPTCAVAGYDDIRSYLLQLFNRLRNDFLEESAGQVKTPDECMNLLDTGNALSVSENIDNS